MLPCLVLGAAVAAAAPGGIAGADYPGDLPPLAAPGPGPDGYQKMDRPKHPESITEQRVFAAATLLHCAPRRRALDALRGSRRQQAAQQNPGLTGPVQGDNRLAG